MLSTKELFEIGATLFEKKWKKQEPELFKAFKTSFFDQYPNWYQGIAAHTPKTNNALESFNGQIKQHQTYWKRKSLNEFKLRVLEMVQDVSREYMCGKSFANEIPVSSDCEKTALMYATSQKEFVLKEKEIDGQKLALFYVRSGEENNKLNDAEVDTYLGQKWKDFPKFDTFIESVNEIYEINFATDPNKWKDSTCSCPQNAKRFICKHVLAIAIRMEIVNIEDDGDQDPLPKNKRRGAPKKAPRGRPLQSDKQ